MNYYYTYPQESLEEQLYLFHQQPKDLSIEQLLSTPIPTLFYIQPPPLSPLSCPSGDSPILHDLLLDELFLPDIECKQLPTPTTIKKKKLLSSHKKSYPPGQCTLPIRVATHKPVRAPRHLACFNCKITKTPLWRRTPDKVQTLCNACGLYYKQYNQHRPVHIRQNNKGNSSPYQQEKCIVPNKCEQPSPSSPPPSPLPPSQQIIDQDDTECINCQQTNTPLWRKNENGDPLCNACGLYAKLHHRDRPVEMRKTTIQRRRRDWAATCRGDDAADANTSYLL